MAEIWEQLPEESNRWYQRFFAFCLMGPGREMNRAYNQERVAAGRPESAEASGGWRNRAKQFRWLERAQAYDKYLSDKAAAEYEARWAAQIMGGTEVLGRLSVQARASVYDFLRLDQNGKIIGFNLDALREHGHLIKKIATKTTATGDEYTIELYDGQAALVKIGQHERLFAELQEITGANGGPIEMRDSSDVISKLLPEPPQA
jgi:hypothetical protein